MKQYIPYSLTCDLFSRNLEIYLHIHRMQSVRNKSIQNIFGNYNGETFKSNSLINFVDAFD